MIKAFLKHACAMALLGMAATVALSNRPPAPQSPTHDGKIESKYDGFNHQTIISLKKMKITCGSLRGNFKEACVSLTATLHCPGIQLDYVREASLQVIFQTKDWDQRHSLEQRDLSVVADGQTYRLGRMRLSSQSTDTLMTETLDVVIPYQVFVKIAKAEVVEMKVGPSQFQLREENILALRDMANRVRF